MKVIGVRFRRAGKFYHFDPGAIEVKKDQRVIVEAAWGSEIGTVVYTDKEIDDDPETLAGVKRLYRIATAEDLAREEDHRDYYDLCVSRAVANMQTLCELCLPFVRRGGYFVAYKGPECVNEVKSAAKAMSTLNGIFLSNLSSSSLAYFKARYMVFSIDAFECS